ncbi:MULTISPECIES: KH domain-containing protein [Anaerococcus]|uniref:RNA-binding protein KhpA n=1 Tax=Anaerococcus octavius TaxID=54007 RepID=A0A380WUM6_9FIRM|nr:MULTISPECIES: KH domain-containing protein [Anaerococcus]MBS6106885.1 KH domain-containing protein [Anaerococcus sp.]MDU2599593.1 KH domain-containing protein [Anaerococcus sp.]MDU4026670.1 KH domain-containing protein [Anaerococcus sp.]MDU5230048.1 KH domain-containing protein [Anaerococcus sp.]MDU5535487.1 KH domain-containing protein [Anaerococcus sp.]
MKELVETIVKELVKEKDQVEIEESRNDGEVNIIIHVAESDKGRVIGVRGNIINSIRTIARSAAIKENVKVNIKI